MPQQEHAVSLGDVGPKDTKVLEAISCDSDKKLLKWNIIRAVSITAARKIDDMYSRYIRFIPKGPQTTLAKCCVWWDWRHGLTLLPYIKTIYRLSYIYLAFAR